MDADLIICAGIVNDSSCNPNSFSNSLGSLAPGKSCLLANISMGTPYIGFPFAKCEKKKKKRKRKTNYSELSEENQYR